MFLICGLMLQLLQTAALNALWNENVEIIRKQICYAALGHKLNLLMVLDTSKYDLSIKKRINDDKDDPVCRVKNGRMRENECDLFNKRPEVTVIYGTLIINPVIRTDSGNYTVTLSDSSGTETSRDLQVIVEAPIGSVKVSLLCSLNGVKRVSCSSDGDQLLYSWTLNGQPLMDGNSSIELKKGKNGHLTCRVKNHISNGQESDTVKPCPGKFGFIEETTAAPVTSSPTSSVASSTQTSNCGMSTDQTEGSMKDQFCILFHCFQLVVLLGLLISFHIYMRFCRKHIRKETRRSKAENEKI